MAARQCRPPVILDDLKAPYVRGGEAVRRPSGGRIRGPP